MITKHKYDVWGTVTILITLFYVAFLVVPLGMIFYQAFFDKETHMLTMDYFIKFFSNKYYFMTLLNSLAVSLSVTVLAVLIGVPLGYFFAVYRIRGKRFMEVLILIASVSAPFIGAYSWILLFGRSGVVTAALSTIGIEMPSIYGFWGIVLVLTFRMFPLIFLYVQGAMKNVDESLLEASESLGRTKIQTFFTVVLPLITPTILAGSLLVFMRAMSDFGTPMLIGGGYRTFPALIYTQFMSEISGDDGFASTIAIIAIILMAIIFMVQRLAANKFSFKMNALHPVTISEHTNWSKVLVHIFTYVTIAIAIIPQVYVIYTSFKNTNGLIFVDGYSFMSYTQAFDKLGSSIWNTIRIPAIALLVIVLFSILIAYVTVRRRTKATGALDIVSMIPYIVPGSVIGIAFSITYRNPWFTVPGLALMLIALVLRRMQYTIRSSVATLSQIPISTEEAAISLGASKFKTFFSVTMPMMSAGIISGAILSWISLITELSSSIILYTTKTQTLTVAIYSQVLRGNYGIAAALSTILTVLTIISILISMKVSDGRKKEKN